ncbi:hypothetical protein D9M72_614620 [compost metagenome]
MCEFSESLLSIYNHGAEFQHAKMRALNADAFLPEEHRPAAVGLDHNGKNGHQGCSHDDQQTGYHYIK